MSQPHPDYSSLFGKPAMTHTLDATQRLTEVSDAWLVELGYRREEVLGRRSTEFLTPTSQELAKEVGFPELLRNRSLGNFPLSFVRAGGSIMNVTMSAIAVNDPSGETRFFAVLTEHRQTNVGLSAQQERLDTIANGIPSFIAYIDDGLIYRFINTHYEILFQMPASDILGRHISDVIGTKSFRQLNGIYQRVLAGETVVRETSPVFSGRQRHLHVTYIPHCSKAGEVHGFYVLGNDMTEYTEEVERRRKAESQLKQAQKLDSLGALAGGIAHDFNNLLTGILSNVDVALDGPHDIKEVLEVMHDIRDAASLAAGLATKLLAYSGGGQMAIEQLEIGECIDGLSRLIRSSMAKRATYHTQFAKPDMTILADPTQVQQLILNLVTNASDALPSGRGDIFLTTSRRFLPYDDACSLYPQQERNAGNYAVIEVRDTGMGMDGPTLERVFDPFFTTHTTGRGLGLATVLGVIRGHRGGLLVQSVPGQGSCFQVFLPQMEESAIAVPAGPAMATNRAGLCLVIDDEPVVRTALARVLKRCNQAMLVAGGGRVGLEMYREHRERIGLVLLDLMMPDVDGAAVLAEIRSLDPEVPVIIMSGYSEHDVRRNLGDNNPTGFLPKPLGVAELKNLLRVHFP